MEPGALVADIEGKKGAMALTKEGEIIYSEGELSENAQALAATAVRILEDAQSTLQKSGRIEAFKSVTGKIIELTADLAASK
mmetsp:Transcript_19702/g.50437  ORF Transcript_19702/g.50437 Transcript_19702/m.50437 type:complete len:82 (-) Transcript_19702:117-362(-)